MFESIATAEPWPRTEQGHCFPNCEQLNSLNLVPWEDLVACDARYMAHGETQLDECAELKLYRLPFPGQKYCSFTHIHTANNYGLYFLYSLYSYSRKISVGHRQYNFLPQGGSKVLTE